VQLDSAVGERLRFGEFELAPVASRPGQILSKDDLTQLVWRGAFVEETALRVGISQGVG
jgi:DNA-binding winged helix-turn-helix (wHTH) protein